MTEKQNDRESPGPGAEKDLRTIMAGRPSGPAVHSRDAESPRWPQEEDHRDEPKPMKLPPVWPGDEKQAWFRRERGMPPLPDQHDSDQELLPEDLPTELADMTSRTQAWLVSNVLPSILFFVPQIGLGLNLGLTLANFVLYRQGQDIGALVFRMRVLRENGDVAGFFHMWTRSFAAVISLLALGAGYWTAYSDPERRTWHDKWMRTYVVKDGPEYRKAKRSSSNAAFKWFIITVLVFIVAPALITMLSLSAADATQ